MRKDSAASSVSQPFCGSCLDAHQHIRREELRGEGPQLQRPAYSPGKVNQAGAGARGVIENMIEPEPLQNMGGLLEYASLDMRQ